MSKKYVVTVMVQQYTTISIAKNYDVAAHDKVTSEVLIDVKFNADTLAKVENMTAAMLATVATANNAV